MRRRAARVGLVLIALGAGLLAQPTYAGAITVTKSAWWSRASDPATVVPPAAAVPGATAPGLPTTPPRPDVPEGSLLVEGTPAGATAIAAITYTVTDAETSPILTVTPSASSNVPDDAVILACLASVDWQVPETQPGPWGEKPLVECRRSVNGIVAGGIITFPLELLLSGEDLDIVLVPGTTGETTPAGAIGSTFSLSFDSAAAVITTTPKSTSSSVPPTTAMSSSATPLPSPSFTAPIADPVVAPALEPQDQAPIVPDQRMATAPAAVSDDTAQGVAFIILLAGAALAALAHLTPDRTEGEGGLGRFSRMRTGTPSRLS